MSSSGSAFITGSAQGIGKAIAQRLAKDGFDVAITDVPAKLEALNQLHAELEQAHSGRFFVTTGDVSSDDDVKRMFEEVVNALGGLDVMVANAGITLFKPFIDTTLEDMDRVYEINVKGVWLCFQYAARQMVKQGRGGQDNWGFIRRREARYEDDDCVLSYQVAVRGLTQAVADELGEHGITVNSYAPGAILTPMVDSILAMLPDPDAFLAAQAAIPPLKRNGLPEDIAGFVSFLASKDSSYMTGQTVLVDGGRYFD